MKRFLNEKFLYIGNSYIVKTINGDDSPYCKNCPLSIKKQERNVETCIPVTFFAVIV